MSVYIIPKKNSVINRISKIKLNKQKQWWQKNKTNMNVYNNTDVINLWSKLTEQINNNNIDNVLLSVNNNLDVIKR